MEEFAIIKGTGDLLSVIQLGQYESYEWEDFSVLKDKEDKEIVWFESEDAAVEFLLANFNKSEIDPSYIKQTSIDGNYYIDSK